MYSSWAFLFALATCALAAPAPYYAVADEGGGAVRWLSARFVTAQTQQLVVPARFGNLAYCSSASVKASTCGKPCDAAPDADILLAEGDDVTIPKFFVAHDKENRQVVVSHQGTNTGNLLSLINDLNLIRRPANRSRFPGVFDGVEIHSGFNRAFEHTADLILDTVQDALSKFSLKKVLIVGHSLGAAIALLDAMHLRLVLPPEVELSAALFGMPRVGNQAFADFVDAKMKGKLTRITNDQDPVPQVPSRLLGFQHPSGEVHMRPGNVFIACNGQDDKECSAGNLIIRQRFKDHLGPYLPEGIPMGGGSCPGFEDEPKEFFKGLFE